MIWSIEFLEEAEKDMKKLDHSAQIQVLKGIKQVSQNPLSVREGGYGKPFGNKSEIWGYGLSIRLREWAKL